METCILQEQISAKLIKALIPFYCFNACLNTFITCVWAHKWSHRQEHSTHKVAGETLMTVPLPQIKYPDRSRRLLAWYKITVSLWSAPLSSTVLQQATDRRLIGKWLITLMSRHMQQVGNQVKNWKCLLHLHLITLHSSLADKPNIKMLNSIRE